MKRGYRTATYQSGTGPGHRRHEGATWKTAIALAGVALLTAACESAKAGAPVPNGAEAAAYVSNKFSEPLTKLSNADSNEYLDSFHPPNSPVEYLLLGPVYSTLDTVGVDALHGG